MIISFCLICHENLKEYCISSDIWQFIAERYSEDNYFEVHDQDPFIPIIKFLESKGYLLTTESSEECLFVKPVGVHYTLTDEDEPVMCVCKYGEAPHEEIVF